MKTVSNKTAKPLRIRLNGGKLLHLAPLKNGQIADHDVDEPDVQRLVREGSIEIQGTGNSLRGGGDKSGGGAVPESTHGHHPPTVVRPKGDR